MTRLLVVLAIGAAAFGCRREGGTKSGDRSDAVAAVVPDAAMVVPDAALAVDAADLVDAADEGRYGPIGGDWGSGIGGVGTGRGGMRGKVSDLPQVRIGMPDTQGGLDKPVIRRYIKRNLTKITYCYEKELNAKPTLEGTVRAQFTISATGAVTSSTASGVDDAVATCIASVIRAIEFPKPQGGGNVNVSYPFVFRPAGG